MAMELTEQNLEDLEKIQPFLESLGHEVQSSGKPWDPNIVPDEVDTQWYISVTDYSVAMMARGIARFMLDSPAPTLVARTHGIYEVII